MNVARWRAAERFALVLRRLMSERLAVAGLLILAVTAGGLVASNHGARGAGGTFPAAGGTLSAAVRLDPACLARPAGWSHIELSGSAFRSTSSPVSASSTPTRDRTRRHRC